MALLENISSTVPQKLLSLLPPHVGGHEIAASQPDLLPLIISLCALSAALSALSASALVLSRPPYSSYRRRW